MLELAILFVVKVIDNILNTTKTLMIQRNKGIYAGIAVVVSQIIYFTIVKNVVQSGGPTTIIVVAVAAGMGTYLALQIQNKFSKDKMYIHVVMSDDKESMKDFRDYLAENKITNSASIGYTRDWEETLQVTVYAETKNDSKVVDRYIESGKIKAKRVIYK